MARSGVIYGPSGSWKTSQVKWFARYIAKKTGKATLLLSSDGGGWEPCRPEVEAGMIRPYRCDSATVPMPILHLVSKGYWPKDPENPRRGFRPVNWDEIGGMAVEGWTSISQVIMRYLPASGISVGGEDRTKLGGWAQDVTVEDAEGQSRTLNLNFRSNTRGDFGFVQAQLYSLVTNFNALPCEYVLYTALESKTEDDDRSTIYGPAIAGKKATAQCGAWVGDLLHAQDYTVPRNIEVNNPEKPGEKMLQTVHDVTVRYFYKKHPDPVTGILFPAKPRVTPERIGDLEKKLPGGYFEPTTSWGIDKYLEFVDSLAMPDDSLKSWREKMDARLGRTAAAK